MNSTKYINVADAEGQARAERLQKQGWRAVSIMGVTVALVQPARVRQQMRRSARFAKLEMARLAEAVGDE